MSHHLYIVARNDHPRPEIPPKYLHRCVHPGCEMEAAGDTDGQALVALTRHMLLAHHGIVPANYGGPQ